MINPRDEAVLERLVGPVTFSRGHNYARSGAVGKRTWSLGGTHVVGEVQGGAAKPYVAAVTLACSRDNSLSSFRATCTCPVGVNCKHAVALVLADEVDEVPSQPAALKLMRGDLDVSLAESTARPVPADPAQAQWELPLQSLLDSDDDRVEDVDAVEIGLQFELLLDIDRSGTAGPGIRVRPVVPGSAGGWVRSGVSWANLDYLGYGRRRSALSAERLALVKEFLALSRVVTRRHAYSYGDEDVRLEAISSRRLWDLFGEATALGLPMIEAGRRGEPISFLGSPVEVTMDVTRTESGLRIAPRIGTADRVLALERTMLIGNPAHGIAWWDEAPAARRGGRALGLAPIGAPIDDGLRNFLRTATFDVPAFDEKRFLRTFVPKIRRKVEVASSDGSVVLPEDRPPTLYLEVNAEAGQRIKVRWKRGADAGEGTEALWVGAGRARQRRAEDAIVTAVTAVVMGVPELFERSGFGRRLANECELAGMTAVRFMTDVLPAIERIEGVKVERSGAVPDYREASAAPLVSLGGTSSGDNDWFDLTISVTVGGEAVPFGELFIALSTGQSHLVLPSGTYFSLDHDDLRELAHLIAEARGLNDTRGDRIRLSRFQASLFADLQRVAEVGAQAQAWESSVRTLVDATDRTELAAPKSLQATLRPYQLTGFNWLAYLYAHRLGGVLADDMGLGKTLQALALMCHTKETGLSKDPYLVVAPTSVVGNWAAECHRFAPDLVVATVTETGRRRGTTMRDVASSADVVITSYSLFRIDYDDYAGCAWAGLFLDEAQFAKNRQSQTYQRAKLLPVTFKVAMSGTPIENNLMELWSLLSISSPGLFASPELFAEYYRLPIERNDDAERLAQLRRRVRPLLLRRTKDQVASDLPDKQEQVLELDLNARHKKIYQTYLQRERQKVLGLLDDMSKNRFAIFKSLTLLRQASLDVGLVDPAHASVPSTKLDLLMEMLDDIVSDGHRVLVFSQFTRFLGLARDRMRAAGIEHCYLDGRTKNRPQVIAEFREGNAPAFLISLKAGGFGLNLTEADYCILLDPWWNPATEAQAVDRVHRIGQTKKVMVYRLVAKDTLEEKVMALKEKKAMLFSNVMDGGGFESGAMTAADIRELLD